MQISKVTFTNDHKNISSQTKKKSERNNFIKNAGYCAGGAGIGEGLFFIYDYFGEKKDYKEVKIKINQSYEQEVQNAINEQIEQLKKSGKTLSLEGLNAMKKFIEVSMESTRDQSLQTVKDYRYKYLKKWGLISAGLGFIAGFCTKIIKDNISPKNNNKNINTQPQKYNNDFYFYEQNKSHMLSFTGIIEEYAEIFSDDDMKIVKSYVNGINPPPSEKELKQAKRIASYKLKDWPKGMKKLKGKESYIADRYLPYRYFEKPTDDREYQMMILKQDFKIPPKPPKFYRFYQKLFKTKTYYAVNNETLPYMRAGLKFERMENLVNKMRLENYQKEKILYDLQAKKQLSLACIKSEINKDFLIDFNSNNKYVKVPNAILIESKDEVERKKNIQWIVAKANSHYVYIQDKNDENEIRVNQIYTVLEEAAVNFKKDGKRTLLVVENFDKLLDKSPENEEIVGDLKDLLCKLSSEYHTTLLFDSNDTVNMDPIALQNHRVTKYNLDKEIPLEKLKIFQNEFVKSNIRKMANCDGFQYRYIPFQNKFIDLFLGDFGYSKNILWVNSNNNEQIAAVLNNLDGIKMVPKFKDIEKVRFPKPENMELLENFILTNTMKKTLDNEYIYEYII